jgi:hypothetical protein
MLKGEGKGPSPRGIPWPILKKDRPGEPDRFFMDVGVKRQTPFSPGSTMTLPGA